MKDFIFTLPTKLYFGESYIEKVGSILKEKSFEKVLIVFGKHSKKVGLIDNIETQLKQENINYFELDDIRVNPIRSKVYQGIKIAKENNVDLILAIGGGSVIDTAKAIACGVKVDFDFFDFNLHLKEVKSAMPIVTILTIAASGSEMSDSCVISDDNLNIKNGFNSEYVRPLISFLNSEYLKTLPKHQMACGITDMFMHTFERYIYIEESSEIADGFALALLKNWYKTVQKYLKGDNSKEVLDDFMLIGSFAHNGLTNIGKKFLMPVHKLEHGVGGFYPNLVHADGLAILLPYFLEEYKTYLKDKLITFGKVVLELDSNNDDKLINDIILKIKSIFHELGMPQSFNELGISFDYLKIANALTKNNSSPLSYPNKNIDVNVASRIYKNSLF
ncbi:MAG: iron-containing alcohol dehydrogenase [Mollicutes bacterium]|nr:iron-containing alcohol dehydrogenase [Mollicutes bacterium]MDD7263437.1 iron-containing alcohol dehydrogenase [bacterium]MDY4978962.1 iron-containing alcohol dehydrogenase [Candidatus Onthovivens sp.]